MRLTRPDPAVGPRRRTRHVVAFSACVVALLLAAPAAPAAPRCGPGKATIAAVGKPTDHRAWRAGIYARTPLWRHAPRRAREEPRWITPHDASWLLVIGAKRDRWKRCWLRVRLPSRPNAAAAWLHADRVELRPTQWRIVVSRRSRWLSVYRHGNRLRRFRVVIGAPPTPTPRGLFSIVGVWRWNPADFLGSYILPLTAHSHVLQEFGGGDGRVGIHGRGAHSLLDPLGAARSHGCVRLSNRAIEWLVRRVGYDGLPGIPVRVR
jgi:lipoprotein-anchoring transpeptidase ErfK/SrfK